MGMTSKITLSVKSVGTKALDLATADDPLDYTKIFDFITGTGATVGNADVQWHDRRTLAASGTEDLDLSGAALTDAFGQALAFVRLKGLLVVASAANTNNVVFSRPAANGVPLFAAASDAIPIQPGGAFLWLAPGAGITVTPGTGDLVTLTNSGAGTPVTYDFWALGATA